MQTKKILETQRLCLYEFGFEDADFIIELVNSPNWLKYIGDRNVKTNEDAVGYLKNGAMQSYQKHGFGLWKILLKNTNVPIKRYITDGCYEIDNNLVENTIRPLALGRKNYLFSGSHNAAQKAAILYSFFATCKINNIDPYTWLKDVLENNTRM